jgi:hypothetical protein
VNLEGFLPARLKERHRHFYFVRRLSIFFAFRITKRQLPKRRISTQKYCI